jgi:hypothetical protein
VLVLRMQKKGRDVMNSKKIDHVNAITELRKKLKPGSRVYVKCEHSSRSGMYHVIKVYITEAGEIVEISPMVARAIGARYDRNHYGVGVSGCGFDSRHEVAYNLGYYLFPKGYTCPGKNCPSCDHANGDRNYRRHHHTDGGYALRIERM